MEYNRIVAVTGLPGLFEVVSSKTDGALVRSLEDKSTRFVSSRVHNLSQLESIEVYTTRENANLADVFIAMQSSSEALPDVKDNTKLKTYFETVFPDMDFERVYSSDMKKMVKWYEILQKNGAEITAADGTSQEAGEESGDEVEVAAPDAAAADAEAPKKTRKKKTEEQAD